MGLFRKQQPAPTPTKTRHTPNLRVGEIVKVIDGHGYEEYFVVANMGRQSISYNGFSKTYDNDNRLELIRIDDGPHRNGSIYSIELEQKVRDEAAGGGSPDDAPDGE